MVDLAEQLTGLYTAVVRDRIPVDFIFFSVQSKPPSQTLSKIEINYKKQRDRSVRLSASLGIVRNMIKKQRLAAEEKILRLIHFIHFAQDDKKAPV
ncbi:MAG: hypothetical protein ABH826_04470 [Patescibacteria group bacterium]